MKRWGMLERRLAKGLALVAVAMAVVVLGPPMGMAGSAADLVSGSNDPSGGADLAVAVSDSIDPVRVGEPFHYNVVVRNVGPADADSVRLEDALPASFELVDATGAKSCRGDGADVDCELGEIPHSGSVTVVLHVRATESGTFPNAATAASASVDPNGGNDTATESTQVLGDEPGSEPQEPREPTTLKVIQKVVNDNGGTAAAGDFTIAVDGTKAAPQSFSGQEEGTTVTLEAGPYAVKAAGPNGYDSSLSSECAGTIAAGETRTCVVTSTDRPAQLTVVNQVVNDDGGTASASSFTLRVKGTAATPSRFAGTESPGTLVTLAAGSYAVSVDVVLGYTTTAGPDCSGTIGVGEAKTCTVTSDDLVPLALTLASDGATVLVGQGAGYTATVTNRNDAPVALRAISVTLPDGFAYRTTSTTGLATADPDISGQTLTWQGSFEVPAEGSASLHFVATAPGVPGSYVATATGSVDAPFTVTTEPSPEATIVVAKTEQQPSAPTTPPSSPAPAGGGGSGADPSLSPPPGTAPPASPTTVPPPVFRKSANVEPVSGQVFVRLPGTTDFVPLDAAAQVPLGTEVDATAGRIGLSTVDARGTGFRAEFYEGRFKIARQLANGVTELRLSGGDFRSCRQATRTFASAEKKKPKRSRSRRSVRHLWGSGKGKFQTKGRFLAATVHGTTWLTEDRCDASKALVREGVVAVRDLVKRKTIQLRAGQSYVARPR